MSDKSISVSEYNNETIILAPKNQLDNNNAHEMVSLINDVHTRGFKFIIIDMAELEFISSAGVGSILGSVDLIRENGGDIILTHVSDSIAHVLEVLDLLEYLVIRPSTEEAVTICH